MVGGSLHWSTTHAHAPGAGIGRLVSEAQAREAPVQRVADEVAGRFCYGVMGAAAATFAFWSLLGVQLFPHVLQDGAFAGETCAAGFMVDPGPGADVLFSVEFHLAHAV
jgi:Cu2+-exporting ATPase